MPLYAWRDLKCFLRETTAIAIATTMTETTTTRLIGGQMRLAAVVFLFRFITVDWAEGGRGGSLPALPVCRAMTSPSLLFQHVRSPTAPLVTTYELIRSLYRHLYTLPFPNIAVVAPLSSAHRRWPDRGHGGAGGERKRGSGGSSEKVLVLHLWPGNKLRMTSHRDRHSWTLL